MPVPSLNRWLRTQALVWVCVLAALPSTLAMVGRVDAVLFAWIGLLAVSYGRLWSLLGAGRHLADWVTLGRFVALVVLATWIWHGGSVTWWLWIGCVLVVLADLLDGFVARRRGGSAGGAILDMEADQCTTLALSVLLHAVVGVGGWVLLLPGYRYLYILFLWTRGMPAHDPKPCDGDNRRARLVCAAMMGLLLLALMPASADIVASVAVGIAVVLLAWSFGADTLFLLRRAAANSAN